MRPYDGETDQHRIVELVCSFPDEQLHVADLPYRLASWALETDRNARVWTDAAGQVLAFAIIQLPWQTLDYFVHPEARELGIEPTMMVWVAERMQEIATENGGPAELFVNVREDQLTQIVLLEQHGFAPAHWYVANQTRELLDVVPEPQLPHGHSVRSARPEEVETLVRIHRAAFGSNSMTVAWRLRAMRAPEYIAELDIIAEAEGQIAAFCCWLSERTGCGQIEPIGVHPDYSRPGLVRALLLEALWRLQAHGAVEARAAAYEDDLAALRLYQSVGFHTAFRTAAYARTFTG